MKYITIVIFSLIFSSIHGQFYNNNKNGMVVSADAMLRVQPDQVILYLGIESRGRELGITKDENFDILNKAIMYCKQNGIPEKYIQTEFIKIHPNYKDRNYMYIDFYQIEQSFNIVIEDLAQYEYILMGLLDLGVNRIDNIDFRTTKMKEYRYQTRKMAIQAAKDKAKFIVAETGIKLGRITNVYEQLDLPSTSFGNNNYANSAQNIYQNVTAYTSVNSLSVGMISIKIKMTLTYECVNDG